MSKFAVLATCNLNQWALDFDGNRERIIESICIAKKHDAKFRIGPELEVCGYGCQDHFLEFDTFLHSWQVLADILLDERCYGIVIDIGMPIMFKGVRYNCRVICLDGRILLIRPKVWLANDGNYREMRYFIPWTERRVETFQLPDAVQRVTHQQYVTIGDCVLDAGNVRIGFETCEEMFTPQSPHIQHALGGVEIFTNSSGSHHEFRKFDNRLALITGATRKCGGVYLYANQRGCDGDRLYYDGSALIVVNGAVVGQASQFSLKDVEVVHARVDLQEVRNYRGAISFGMQTLTALKYEMVHIDSFINDDDNHPSVRATRPLQKVQIFSPQQEVALGPACWLWDYLRRSNAAGFFLPLSGGIDSCSTALIVFSMCRIVVKECAEGNETVIADARRLAQQPEPYVPTDPREFCNRIFTTCYMGTDNSSPDTRRRARLLAETIGSHHLDTNIQSCVQAMVALVATIFGKTPQYRVKGGSTAENLALQNVQARLRMVLAYTLAMLVPFFRGISGSLLVLGSGNVDEALRGYFTKYDNSSADINPIGSISKQDLKKFVEYCAKTFESEILYEFLDATPTAELEPITAEYTQSDEVDMGLTYEELSVFGKLRKVHRLGPYSTFMRLRDEWQNEMPMDEIAAKVKRFFYYYAINRHKMTVLTPSYHAEAYSPDDNRFDLRPFLYRPFPYQFKLIDDYVKQYSDEK